MSSKKMPHMAGLIRATGASVRTVMRTGAVAAASSKLQPPSTREITSIKFQSSPDFEETIFAVEPSDEPTGFGLRQSSGAFAWCACRWSREKRQRTGAVQDADAFMAAHCFRLSRFGVPPLGGSRVVPPEGGTPKGICRCVLRVRRGFMH